MDIFDLRNSLIKDYSDYITSFITIKDEKINSYVNENISQGLLWPDPLIQLNPSFEVGDWIDNLVNQKILHQECGKIFRIKSTENPSNPLRLHKHQLDAIKVAQTNNNYVLTTGTGSGKSLSYIIPVVDYVLKNGSGKGIQAIVVYPMNALANSQFGELEKFICLDYPKGKEPITFKLYTGQETDQEKNEIIKNPPDILLTNYVMLELLLTRPQEKKLITNSKNLKFLVIDELHTYRGRQGSDVAMLIRRVKDRFKADDLQCVGTSATLAGPGTFDEQRQEVSKIASILFGSEVKPESVISETLKRATPYNDINSPDFIEQLSKRLNDDNYKFSNKYHEFINDPLAIWIESIFGVKEDNGRLVRCKPISISGENGAGKILSDTTSIPREKCEVLIKEALISGYNCEKDLGSNYAPFAFRLHQFISRGDTVYSSLEKEDKRYITIQGQRFVPGDRSRVLLPLSFCRECGQEYYTVKYLSDNKEGKNKFLPRLLSDQVSYGNEISGFLYSSKENPWSEDFFSIIDRIPEDWLEDYKGNYRVKTIKQKEMPRLVKINLEGIQDSLGDEFYFIQSPFHFCLNCGVTYGSRQKSDFGKLSSLSAGGRSTATTILSLSTINKLKNSDLKEEAKKLLSFTDNRQDASLQSGHFNDFIEVGLLRAALYKAVFNSSEITHEDLTHKVFQALDLPFEYYANDPNVMFNAKKDKERALKDVLGYRLYRDLERGWRITSPNLEQCGLLEIKYQSLEDVCSHEPLWNNLHPILSNSSSQDKMKVSKVLLDYMRRELAIKVDYLDQDFQDKIKQRSSQHLIAPWSIDENEVLEYSSIIFPRSKSGKEDTASNIYLSSRSAFGQYLRRASTFTNNTFGKISLQDTEIIIRDLLKALSFGGLVEEIIKAKNEKEVSGYQLPASAILWVKGEGKTFSDPLRTIRESNIKIQNINEFFSNFYKNTALNLLGLEAREHTAQVDSQERVNREKSFRAGKLPILYCSPTMELGVDISDLNVVNMRNVPPTPANYAQRSGRAGRSGQPALVFSYCSIGSSHDQYFFKRPHLMVSGSVSTPRLDLANEELIKAHVQSIWLSEVELYLGTSLKDILDLTGDNPSLSLQTFVIDQINNTSAKQKAIVRAKKVLDSIINELNESDWYHENWIEDVINNVTNEFDQKCNRWRELYTSALNQAKVQSNIILDATRSHSDKDKAQKLRKEAESQIKLLSSSENISQSDFYSYRYFASEGFLPGYSFPRLPLSAYLPAKRGRGNQRDEFLTRARFLAISEFGPRSIIYHEGSKYIINKVILPVTGEDNILTTSIKQCENCGYIHSIDDRSNYDLCENCGSELPIALNSLFRLQNVSTKRRDKINSDEEERTRMGYEIKSGIRFSEINGKKLCRTALVKDKDSELAKITYANTATLWRINLGWNRRVNKSELGFVLDKERGFWASNNQLNDDSDDPLSSNTIRVVPYVEDRRNTLILEINKKYDVSVLASFQSAIKNAIQVLYQLEESELASEPLPSLEDRKYLLFYESAEGGAGVLRRLVDDSNALSRIAKKALELCHYDPETGLDLKRALGSKEDCEAACYDCLMSYSNQKEHDILDRKLIKDLLMELSKSRVESSPNELTRNDHLEQLKRLSGSSLEDKWLDYLDQNGYKLPESSQELIEKCKTRPDFSYGKVLIYIDGPIHDYPEKKALDISKMECLEDYGYTVIRFDYDDSKWEGILKKYPNIFGTPSNLNQNIITNSTGLDLDLFDERLHSLLTDISNITDINIDSGEDILYQDRVIASYNFSISYKDKFIRIASKEDIYKINNCSLLDNIVYLELNFDNIDYLKQQILEILGV